MRGFSDGDIFKQTLLNKEINVFFFQRARTTGSSTKQRSQLAAQLKLQNELQKKTFLNFIAHFFIAFKNSMKLN